MVSSLFPPFFFSLPFPLLPLADRAVRYRRGRAAHPIYRRKSSDDDQVSPLLDRASSGKEQVKSEQGIETRLFPLSFFPPLLCPSSSSSAGWGRGDSSNAGWAKASPLFPFFFSSSLFFLRTYECARRYEVILLTPPPSPSSKAERAAN